MGKRLPRQQLLGEIEQQRTALNQILALIPQRLMTKRGVTQGGWSVKDILGHLVEWQRMNLNWYATGQRGEKPALPAPGYSWREISDLNQQIYRKYRRRSLQAVLEDYESYHARMITLIQTLSDEDLIRLGRFSWTGPSWTLSDYIRANTAAHYLWAHTRIRRWWKGQEEQKRKHPK
jgi:hypothetical protein